MAFLSPESSWGGVLGDGGATAKPLCTDGRLDGGGRPITRSALALGPTTRYP